MVKISNPYSTIFKKLPVKVIKVIKFSFVTKRKIEMRSNEIKLKED